MYKTSPKENRYRRNIPIVDLYVAIEEKLLIIQCAWIGVRLCFLEKNDKSGKFSPKLKYFIVQSFSRVEGEEEVGERVVASESC